MIAADAIEQDVLWTTPSQQRRWSYRRLDQAPWGSIVEMVGAECVEIAQCVRPKDAEAILLSVNAMFQKGDEIHAVPS